MNDLYGVTDIARRHGVSLEGIYRFLREQGWNRKHTKHLFM